MFYSPKYLFIKLFFCVLLPKHFIHYIIIRLTLWIFVHKAGTKDKYISNGAWMIQFICVGLLNVCLKCCLFCICVKNKNNNVGNQNQTVMASEKIRSGTIQQALTTYQECIGKSMMNNLDRLNEMISFIIFNILACLWKRKKKFISKFLF